MNPFFDRVLLYVALSIIALHYMADSTTTFGIIFWGAPLALDLYFGGSSLRDWWTKYRGITDEGARVADTGVLLKRKVRG